MPDYTEIHELENKIDKQTEKVVKARNDLWAANLVQKGADICR
jgi:hypothetical protein